MKEGKFILVRFPKLNKNNDLETNNFEIENESTIRVCMVRKTVVVNKAEWNNITQDLLNNRETWEEIGGCELNEKALSPSLIEKFNACNNLFRDPYLLDVFWRHSFTNVVELNCENETIYINTEGYSYARYVGNPVDPKQTFYCTACNSLGDSPKCSCGTPQIPTILKCEVCNKEFLFFECHAKEEPHGFEPTCPECDDNICLSFCIENDCIYRYSFPCDACEECTHLYTK